ncbi:MAG: hypothetical protein D6795_16120, partial [Deltaproteobacteria bacterium]
MTLVLADEAAVVSASPLVPPVEPEDLADDTAVVGASPLVPPVEPEELADDTAVVGALVASVVSTVAPPVDTSERPPVVASPECVPSLISPERPPVSASVEREVPVLPPVLPPVEVMLAAVESADSSEVADPSVSKVTV